MPGRMERTGVKADLDIHLKMGLSPLHGLTSNEPLSWTWHIHWPWPVDDIIIEIVQSRHIAPLGVKAMRVTGNRLAHGLNPFAAARLRNMMSEAVPGRGQSLALLLAPREASTPYEA